MERLTCNKLKTICDGYFVNLASKEEATKYRMLAESAPKYEELYKRLVEYEDLEEQGLLVKLPCKVGDTVYEISRVESYRNPAIREMGVVDILLRDNDMYFTLQDLYDKDYDNSILSTEFGYTVFFTMEQADQALSEMKGE